MLNKTSIGVFVCECGDKIAGGLDVSRLVEQARNLPGVAWAGSMGRWCQPGNVEKMQQIAAAQNLERVVIGGCSPRTHRDYFRQALGSLNPGLIDLINLRDLCAQPHQDDASNAQAKAWDQIAMAVADMAERQIAPARSADIYPAAVVIGGDLAGLTAALGLSDAHIPVTLIETGIAQEGNAADCSAPDMETDALLEKCLCAVRDRPDIQVITQARINSIEGSIGHYWINLADGRSIEAGAVILTGDREPDALPDLAWPDVKTSAQRYAFVLCDLRLEEQASCRHACCLTALRRAVEIKKQFPACDVSIFFRELYTAGGMYNEFIWEAQQAGVAFVRYPAGQTPQPIKGKIQTLDELTGRKVLAEFDRILYVKPSTASDQTRALAQMLRLPVDQAGFSAEARIRLRPNDYLERGIFICGRAHQPCDAQRALFEALSAANRAGHYIRRKQIRSRFPSAHIDPTRCNGCGDCVKVCPFMAIILEPRGRDPLAVNQERPPLAKVDPLICVGCGNCVSICPVKAVQVPTSLDDQIEAQISEALNFANSEKKESRLIVFACEWSGYAAAEMAGSRQLSYPACTRIIRLNCIGRLQPGLILKALEKGATGVLILGCHPGTCHYELGNERCATAFDQAKALARLLALDDRLKLEWIAPDDPERFVEIIKFFNEDIKNVNFPKQQGKNSVIC